ncbi:MAG: 30S ribosomal protein S8 [Candidatus Aenigmarchaeota archaeon]|nr:30S ribosomal protein S8 [Candidatus Aenigmarchaeota archaeon]
MRHDMLADMFCTVKNAESTGKRMCIISATKLIKEILVIMQKNNYIGNFELIEDGKNGKYKVELTGRVNNCRVVRPRFEIGSDEIIRWEKRYLPSVNVGLMFVSTSKGVMSHSQAKKEGIGGVLLGYIY